MNKRSTSAIAVQDSDGLSGLVIRGYRRFERLSLNEFRRINLIVGPNNSGKTSLLEAIQLLSLAGNLNSVISALVENARRRGEVSRDERDNLLADLSHVFEGHNAAIGHGFMVGPNMRDEHLAIGIVDGRLLKDKFADRPAGYHHMFGIGLDLRWSGEQEQLPLWTSGLFPPPLETWPAMWSHGFDSGAPFVALSGVTGGAMRSMWDDAVRHSHERIAIDALKLIESRVNGIVFLTQESGGESPSAGVLIGLEGSETKIPLGSMGDGMVRALMLALVMIRATGGVLLIDEIDTGLHYSLMPSFWEFLIETSRQMNVQVFATTHSHDCITGLGDAIRRSPDLLSNVSVQKLAARLDHAVAFHGDTLLAALANDVELRG
jgi:hypothetical protein